jgi:hypothetical protein
MNWLNPVTGQWAYYGTGAGLFGRAPWCGSSGTRQLFTRFGPAPGGPNDPAQLGTSMQIIFEGAEYDPTLGGGDCVGQTYRVVWQTTFSIPGVLGDNCPPYN